jgi:type III pantothenate kinase
MSLDLVLDIGNSLIKAGLFDAKTLVDVFILDSHTVGAEELKRQLNNRTIKRALISSVNTKAQEAIAASLKQQKIDYTFLDYTQLKLILDVDEPQQLGHDRIANCYGALLHFPLNNCIVIDIGTAITADFIAKEGRYLGGMIYIGAALCAKALADYTDKLPLVSLKKPSTPLARTTQTHLQGGIYYGQLGAIERMIDELRLSCDSPSSVKIIATGGATRIDNTSPSSDKVEWIDDLKELVDFIDPHLTLIGLREILTELTK